VPGFKNNIKSFQFSEAKGIAMKMRHNRNRIDTTLGELIATVSDIALEISDDTKQAYDLAHRVLVEMLKGATLRSEIVQRRISISNHRD
jgi:hypothetical protein